MGGSRIGSALGLLLALALAGCAGSGSPGDPYSNEADEGGLRITVNNDLIPPAALTVYIEPESGGRRRLGTMNPAGRRTFRYSPGLASLEHRLVADVDGGRIYRSNPFSLSGISSVSWDVTSPVVRRSR